MFGSRSARLPLVLVVGFGLGACGGGSVAPGGTAGRGGAGGGGAGGSAGTGAERRQRRERRDDRRRGPGGGAGAIGGEGGGAGAAGAGTNGGGGGTSGGGTGGGGTGGGGNGRRRHGGGTGAAAGAAAAREERALACDPAYLGTFAAEAMFPGGTYSAYWLVAGDFDRDGKLDVATANSADGTVSVLRGTGRDRSSLRRRSQPAAEPTP